MILWKKNQKMGLSLCVTCWSLETEWSSQDSLLGISFLGQGDGQNDSLSEQTTFKRLGRITHTKPSQ